MTNFKVIFRIEDGDGNILIADQQQVMKLDAALLLGPDTVEASRRHIERLRDGQEPNEAELAAAAMVRETCMAAGNLIGRFININLRGWAKRNV